MTTEPFIRFEDRLAVALDPVADSALRLTHAAVLAGDGLFAEMAGVCAEVAAGCASDPALVAMATRLARTCRQFERWGVHHRLQPWLCARGGDRARAERTNSALLLRREGSRRVIIVFVGAASQHWVTLYLLERYLPTDCHILFLKDPDQTGYCLGSPALGARHADIAPALMQLITDLGAHEHFVLGTSSGGFAALHFAFGSGAKGCLALSPETTIAPTVHTLAPQWEAKGGKAFAQDIAARMPRPLDLLDLPRPEAGAGVPTLLVYASGHSEDATMCDRLRDWPNVALWPIPDFDQHDVLAHLVATGEIRPLIQRFLGMPD